MKNVYAKLGLSDSDIALLKKYKLTSLLDKMKEQQSQLERQKRELEKALRKIERDLNSARDAQLNMLPKEFSGVPEIEFRARFYPSQYVSGDIYNIFRLDEKHIGLYHIDISGHGVPAALFSVSLSQLLNTNISSRNLLKVPAMEPPFYKINPPDKVVAMLNEDQSFERYGIFFTMIYMIIDIQRGIINYTRAGHNPPLIMRANGQVEYPQEGGLPIGWNFPRNDQVLEYKIQRGDRIFMFSDGITEAANSVDQLFSVQRLQDVLKNSFILPLSKSLDAVIHELRRFTGQDSFEDDVSIIGLSWI